MDPVVLKGMTPRQLRRVCTLEAIAAWDNLFLAAAKARRGKTRRPDVEAWSLRRESELRALRDEILGGTWQPGEYRRFTIHEPKRREIAAAPFRDRVVHHALCNLLAPVLERRFIARSFSCQVGKGTTAARECCRQLVNQYRYVLKCDVRKFFPSLDHAILEAKLAEWVGCPGAREVMRQILASFHTGNELPAVPFPGDDWLAAAGRPRGVPIGNLTSQLWGNFYLDDLDHRLTEEQRHGAYVRYTDDFLLFGNNPTRLWELRADLVAQLAAVRLRLAEPKSRMLATREGVPFCGFRFVPGGRPRILGATKRRFERRRLRLLRAGNFRRSGRMVFSWYQFSREACSTGLRQTQKVPMIEQLRAWWSRRCLPKPGWRLVGYDSFADEPYPIAGIYATKAETQAAARAYEAKIERTQPRAQAGNLQDKVYVLAPEQPDLLPPRR